MNNQIFGPVKYFISGIVFALVGIPLFIKHILSGSIFALTSFAAIIMSVFSFYFWIEAKNGKQQPEKDNRLFITFLLSWIGMTFAILGIKEQTPQAYIPGLIIFIFITPIFILEVIRIVKYFREKPTEKIEQAIKKTSNIMILFLVIAAVSPILAIIVSLFINGEIVLPSIILLILIFFVWLFVKMKKK